VLSRRTHGIGLTRQAAAAFKRRSKTAKSTRKLLARPVCAGFMPLILLFCPCPVGLGGCCLVDVSKT
jgi:hypothetical protein